MKKQAPGKGGKRKGAGAKLVYGEPTEVVRRSVPISKVPLFEKKIDAILKKWKVKK